MDSPQPVHKLRGQVTRGEYGKGSKSERVAVFIDTDRGRYLLRRKNSPAFVDADLEHFIGKTVECDGFLLETTLLAEHIKPID